MRNEPHEFPLGVEDSFLLMELLAHKKVKEKEEKRCEKDATCYSRSGNVRVMRAKDCEEFRIGIHRQSVRRGIVAEQLWASKCERLTVFEELGVMQITFPPVTSNKEE
jgi:hypothetical protein